MTGEVFPISPEEVDRGQVGKERILSEKREFRLIICAFTKKQKNILYRVTLASHQHFELTPRLQMQRESQTGLKNIRTSMFLKIKIGNEMPFVHILSLQTYQRSLYVKSITLIILESTSFHEYVGIFSQIEHILPIQFTKRNQVFSRECGDHKYVSISQTTFCHMAFLRCTVHS